MPRFQGIPVEQPTAPPTGGRFGGIPVQGFASAPAAPDVPNVNAVTPPSQPRPTPSLGQKIGGAAEAAGALVSGVAFGIPAYAEGLLKGGYELATGGQYGSQAGAEKFAQTVAQNVQSGILEPSTETGQRYTQAVGKTLEPLAHLGALAPMAGEMGALASGLKQAAPAVKQAVGKLNPFTRDPLIDANTGRPMPAFEKALKAQGVEVEAVLDDLPRLSPTLSPEQAAKQLITRKIRAGDTDGFLSKKMLTKAGELTDDAFAIEAVKQGIKEGDVQSIKNANAATKFRMEEMLKIKREIHGNSRAALDMRPSNVIGKSTEGRISYIKDVANNARIKLNNIAENKLGGKEIDKARIKNELLNQFDKLDIDYNESSFLGRKDDYSFEGSMISKDKKSQRVINSVVSLLSENRKPDAKRAHKLKRQLDAMIDYQSREGGGLTESGEKLARSVRQTLNAVIREVDPEYGAVNDTLHKSITAIDDLQRVMGPSINLKARHAESAIGQDLRSLLSNNKKRGMLDDAITQLDMTARDLGGKFSDDIGSLVLFDKVLDEKFGATARRGFAGEIESAAARGLDVATGGKTGLLRAGVGMAKDQLKKAQGINDQNAFKSLDQLIKRK